MFVNLIHRNDARFVILIHQNDTRTRLYSDEPPPYDLVTSDHYLSGHIRPHSPHTHPHPDPESPHHHQPPSFSLDGASSQHHPHYHNDQGSGDPRQDPLEQEDQAFNAGYSDDDDDLQPPPHYEDFIRDMESMRTTRL
ncbi:hypothetical protein ACOMHN_043071 [Nucella lapillus]